MTEKNIKGNAVNHNHKLSNKKSQRNSQTSIPNNKNPKTCVKKKTVTKTISQNGKIKSTKISNTKEKKITSEKQPQSDLDDKVKQLQHFYRRISFRKWVFRFRSKEHEQKNDHGDFDNNFNDPPKKFSHKKLNKNSQPDNVCRYPPRRSVDRIRRQLPKFNFSHIPEAHREKYDVKLLWPVNNILFPPEFDEERHYTENSPTRKDYLAQVEADNRLSKPKTAKIKVNNFENEKLKRKKLTKKGVFKLCQRLNTKHSTQDKETTNNKNANQNANNDKEDNLKNEHKKHTVNKRQRSTGKQKTNLQKKTLKKNKQVNRNENDQIITKKDINTSPIRHEISVDSDDSSEIANIINTNQKILNIKQNDKRTNKDQYNLDPNDITELSPNDLSDNNNHHSDSVSENRNQQISNNFNSNDQKLLNQNNQEKGENNSSESLHSNDIQQSNSFIEEESTSSEDLNAQTSQENKVQLMPNQENSQTTTSIKSNTITSDIKSNTDNKPKSSTEENPQNQFTNSQQIIEQNYLNSNEVRKSNEILDNLNEEQFSSSSVGVADMIGDTDSDIRLINDHDNQSFSSETDSLL